MWQFEWHIAFVNVAHVARQIHWDMSVFSVDVGDNWKKCTNTEKSQHSLDISEWYEFQLCFGKGKTHR